MHHDAKDSGPQAASWDYGKATSGYRMFERSLEPEAVPSAQEMTAVDSFFVCNAGNAGDIDPDEWSLRVHGAVTTPVEVNLAELSALPRHTVVAWLECAGNGRRLFAEVAGYETDGKGAPTPWSLNGMGLARWSGPRLGDVLALAGLEPSAQWISMIGLDLDTPEIETPRMSLPLQKALHEDTIIALTMNGAPLIRSHGAPARMLVPGWVGAYSIKWLGEILVSPERSPTWRGDEYYVHRDNEGVSTGPITTHPVKSNLALDFPATLSPGRHQIGGFARSGDAPIHRVMWRIGGGDWSAAELGKAKGRWAWTPFFIAVDIAVGNHVIETLATDDLGNSQPLTQRPHPNGVLWSAVTPHPIIGS